MLGCQPTNDLDLETLELLEERLVDYQGTLLIVSHDRAFLNNVVTSSLVFEPGGVKEYVGGYDDWLRQRAIESPEPVPAKLAKPVVEKRKDEPAAKRRLSFKEQQEHSALPATIEQLETQIAELHQAMGGSDFYQQAPAVIVRETERLKEAEAKLITAYARWEELEQRVM